MLRDSSVKKATLHVWHCSARVSFIAGKSRSARNISLALCAAVDSALRSGAPAVVRKSLGTLLFKPRARLLTARSRLHVRQALLEQIISLASVSLCTRADFYVAPDLSKQGQVNDTAIESFSLA